MSGYEKPQDSYVYGYTTTRPDQERSYAGPIQPSFDPLYPSTQVDESHALVSTHQMPYLGHLEPRDSSYQTGSASLIDAGARLSPEIISTGPYSGRPGETFRLSVRSKVDYTTQNISFTVLFGQTAATKSSLTKNFHRELYYHYTLETQIPPSSQTPSTMPLLLEVTDENDQNVNMKALANFTYLDSSPYQRYNAPLEVPKKRKYGADMSGYSQTSAKRSASTPLQAKPYVGYPSVSDASAFNFDANASLYALPTGYDRPVTQRSYMPAIAQRPPYSFSESPPVQNVRARTPSMGSYGGYSATTRPSPSPRMRTASQASRAPTNRSSSTSSNPRLIRTSILQPQTATSLEFRTPGFNPYSIYPSAKAKLEIQGDLRTMCEDWTLEELKVKRRLVEFHRSQEDSIINTSFKPVTLEERTQGTHCVSCILWEERNECYVTSVDTIQLLEGLVGVRFTVEEKNRIRRNLEGFKPLTVSKQKEDSESFFRLIMGFPNPKPRNIEKDVKVFPWSILGNALRKIISKYSASYASTSSILPPSSNVGFASSVAEAVIEHHPTASPRSTTSSVASHGYQMGLTSTAMPAHLPLSGPYEQMRPTSQSMAPMGQWSNVYPPVSGISQYGSERSSWQYTPVTTVGAHQLYYQGDATGEPTDDKFYHPTPTTRQP